jgi:hypothetical protein
VTWRCSECGRSRSAAEKLRERRGLGALRRGAVTCSPECAARRDQRRLDETARARRGLTPPRGDEWRCAVCGCDTDAMIRRRRRRGLALVFRVSLTTCGPVCQRARAKAIALERQRRFLQAERRCRRTDVR